MWLIKNPQNYGVIVTSNLFGDIMSDVAAQLARSDWDLPRAGTSATPSRSSNRATVPLPSIRGEVCRQSLLDDSHDKADAGLAWRGTKREGPRKGAVAAVIAEGSVRTYDMGGKRSTRDMANAITERYKEMTGA